MFKKKKIKLRSIFSDSEFRTIFNNSVALLIIQGTNFLLPLLLLPYLIRVLGFEKFGLISLAQSFVAFWIIFTDYGFQISATKEIALHKHTIEKLSSIVNNTIKTKLTLCAFAFLLYCVVIYTVPTFSKYSSFYLLTFIMVVGQSFVPIWFFQGIEKMQFLTYINFISKTLFTILIFILIKQPSDYKYVTLLYGLGNLIAGIVGTYIMYTRFSLTINFFGPFNIIKELKEGWYLFISNFSITAYLNLNILVLGFFGSEMLVGYYSIAEKVIGAVKILITIFSQATFPKVCQQKEKGQEYLQVFFRKYFLPFTAFILFVCLGLIIMADHVALILSKEHIKEISWAIRLLSIVPVIVCLNTPAYQTLLAYNFQKSYMAILLSGSFLNIVLNLLLVKPLLMTGTIISVITTEAFITIGLFTILHIKHHPYSPLNFNFKFIK